MKQALLAALRIRDALFHTFSSISQIDVSFRAQTVHQQNVQCTKFSARNQTKLRG